MLLKMDKINTNNNGDEKTNFIKWYQTVKIRIIRKGKDTIYSRLSIIQIGLWYTTDGGRPPQ